MKMNILLVLNKNHKKYQFKYGIFRHDYYAIFNQCTKSKSKSVSYILTVKSIKSIKRTVKASEKNHQETNKIIAALLML